MNSGSNEEQTHGNYKCCTSDADGIIRKWALPDQSEDCNCNYQKVSVMCTSCPWNKAQNLLFNKA